MLVNKVQKRNIFFMGISFTLINSLYNNYRLLDVLSVVSYAEIQWCECCESNFKIYIDWLPLNCYIVVSEGVHIQFILLMTRSFWIKWRNRHARLEDDIHALRPEFDRFHVFIRVDYF